MDDNAIPRRYTHLVVYRCTCGHWWYEGARRPQGYYACLLCRRQGVAVWYSDLGKDWARLARRIIKTRTVPFEDSSEYLNGHPWASHR